MRGYVILAESGCDISPQEAERRGIEIVPMHASLGGIPFDDGSADPRAMLEESKRIGVVPRTSGCTPADFDRAFDRIHERYPEAAILYLAYSAITTCSFESARIAAKDRPYVAAIDTKHCSCGHGLVVLDAAQYLELNPNASVSEIERFVVDRRRRARMAFVPGDLSFLKEGGRLSNAAYFGACLLKIRPVVEVVDGKLVATKKLRGGMHRVALALLDHLTAAGPLDRERVRFVRTAGLDITIQKEVEEKARLLGFRNLEWADAGCVVSSHCGPGTFGAAVLASNETR